MSYFTETLQMMTSVLEFRSDIAASYSTRRASEKMSGDHTVGGVAMKSAKAYNAGSDEGVRDAKGYLRRELNSREAKRTADNISKDKDARKALVHGFKSELKHDKNSKREFDKLNSLSSRGLTSKNAKAKMEGYDPVYEDLCAMGIID